MEPLRRHADFLVKRLLAPLLAAALVSPEASYGQRPDDQAHCAELTALYRRYVHNAPGRRFDLEAVWALDNCRGSNAAAAIAILEKRLEESRISVPKEFKP